MEWTKIWRVDVELGSTRSVRSERNLGQQVFAAAKCYVTGLERANLVDDIYEAVVRG